MHISDEKSVCSQPGYVSYVLPNVFTIQLYFLFQTYCIESGECVLLDECVDTDDNPCQANGSCQVKYSYVRKCIVCSNKLNWIAEMSTS